MYKYAYQTRKSEQIIINTKINEYRSIEIHLSIKKYQDIKLLFF